MSALDTLAEVLRAAAHRGSVDDDATDAVGQALVAEDATLPDLFDVQTRVLAELARERPAELARGVELVGAVLRTISEEYEMSRMRAAHRSSAHAEINGLLRAHSSSLESLNLELDQARAIAERAAHDRALFLANMSHELRTPLNAIVGLASLLRLSEMAPSHVELVGTMMSSAEHLLSLVNDILDFSKLESGSAVLEQAPVHLPSCLQVPIDLSGRAALDKGLELGLIIRRGVPETILGDAVRLRQVVVNLVSNAVKFTSSGSVVVEAEVDNPEAPAELTIAVRDDGVGIPPDRLGDIFDVFAQADSSTTRRYGGTGLGLAISRQIVRLMGGALTVESEVGVGSTFAVKIPLRTSDADVAPPRRFPRGSLRGLSLLQLDGSPLNRTVVAENAARWGMRHRSTARLDEALAWLDEGQRFDVVLLADRLRAAAGDAPWSTLMSALGESRTRLIQLSSMTNRGDEAVEAARFRSIVRRPINASVLFDHIASAVGIREEEPDDDATSRAATLPLRILLAEDNPVNQLVATTLLERLGHPPTAVVGDGAQAVEAAREHVYDLILMDMQMPTLDGLGATRQILELYARSPVRPRIVALTAEALEGDRERMLRGGVDDYLSKPITLQSLARALSRSNRLEHFEPPGRLAGAAIGAVAEEARSDGAEAPVFTSARRDELLQSFYAARESLDRGDFTRARRDALEVLRVASASGVAHRVPALTELVDSDDAHLVRYGVLIASRCQRQLRAL
ncbi:MAG: ATP-binding protein [Nannocystaceae bacterium]